MSIRTVPTRVSVAESIRDEVAQLRLAAAAEARPKVLAGGAPIRVMARMVTDLAATCRERGIPEEIIAEMVINRSIGDVDTRKISATLDGARFVPLADEMGLALPGEDFDGGYVATGKRYRWLRNQMLRYERMLLKDRWDLRMYDLAGVGNPLLREMLAAHAQRLWGFTVPREQIHVSLGSLDGLNKFWQGLRALNDMKEYGVIFPAPGFNVPEWQVQTMGLRMERIVTRAEDHFKVTPDQLRAALEPEDVRIFYFIASSNPTAFAYSPDELRALFDVVLASRDDVLIVADLAYVGTGEVAEDRARMAVFSAPEVLKRSVLVNSFSKTHTLTGDRFGWVVFGDADLAQQLSVAWMNSCASLPADWQLRYMAVAQLFHDHPEIEDDIRALYRLRREKLVRQLHAINREHHLFAKINTDDGGTVYNWSQLRQGEDVFSLFAKTGIAGVPGSAFGYSDDYIRLSVGINPVPDVEE
ncbi:MAG TPA: pyridoxal phosphate-dependent aminotransferase [Ktedonobacterales bacterium]